MSYTSWGTKLGTLAPVIATQQHSQALPEVSDHPALVPAPEGAACQGDEGQPVGLAPGRVHGGLPETTIVCQASRETPWNYSA